MKIPEWREIAKWADDRIEQARTDLENPAMDHGACQILRGRIAAYRDILKLGDTPKKREIESTPHGY